MAPGEKSDQALDAPGTLSQGERLDNAAADVDEAQKITAVDTQGVVATLPFIGHPAFGDHGAGEAFAGFARTWRAEGDVLSGALREIHGRIGEGVATTVANDHGTAGAFEGAASDYENVSTGGNFWGD